MKADVVHPARVLVRQAGARAPRHALVAVRTRVDLREAAPGSAFEAGAVTLRHVTTWPKLVEAPLTVLMHPAGPFVPLHVSGQNRPPEPIGTGSALAYLKRTLMSDMYSLACEDAFRGTPVQELPEAVDAFGVSKEKPEALDEGRLREVAYDGRPAAAVAVAEFLRDEVLVDGDRLLRRFNPVLVYDGHTRSWGFSVGRPDPFLQRGGFGHPVDRPSEAEAFAGKPIPPSVREAAAAYAAMLPAGRDPLSDVRVGIAAVAARAAWLLRGAARIPRAAEAARAEAAAFAPVQLALRIGATPDRDLPDAVLAVRRALEASVSPVPPTGDARADAAGKRMERIRDLGRRYLDGIAVPRLSASIASAPEDVEAIGSLAP